MAVVSLLVFFCVTERQKNTRRTQKEEEHQPPRERGKQPKNNKQWTRTMPTGAYAS
jgi:hypothetical protein